MFYILKKHYGGLLMLIILAAYAVLQVHFFTPAVTETDTAGYLLLSERIARGGPLTFSDDDPFQYHSHVWVQAADGGVIPKYPPGLPFLMAIGSRLLGDNIGPFVVSPVMGGLALIGMYQLFALWMSRPAAVLAVFAIAVNHVFLTYSGYPLAHAVNLCVVTWGMYFLWKWEGLKHWLHGAAAGLFLGFAPLVRASGVLFVLTAATACIFMVVHERFRIRQLWRPLLGLAAGYALFPFLHMAYNAAVFGNPLMTGYALTDEQWAYSLVRMLANVPWALRGFGGECIVVLFGVGLAGMLFCDDWKNRLMRFSWWVPLFLLYTAYYWANPRFGLAFYRFYICLIPVFVGSAFLLLDRLEGGRRKFLTMGAIAILVLTVNLDRAADGLRQVVHSATARNQMRAADAAQELLSEKAVIYAASPAAFYIGRGKGFKLYDLSVFDPGYARRSFMHQDETAPRRQPERTERLRRFYENKDGEALVEMRNDLMRSQIEQGRQVALVIPVQQVRHYKQGLPDDLQLVELGTWTGLSRHWARRNGRHVQESTEHPWGAYELTLKSRQS